MSDIKCKERKHTRIKIKFLFLILKKYSQSDYVKNVPGLSFWLNIFKLVTNYNFDIINSMEKNKRLTFTGEKWLF